MSEVSLNLDIDFSQESCKACGAVFWIEARKMRYARNNNGSYWCPGCGTRWTFLETEADRLRRKLKDAEESRDWYKGRMENEQKRHSATKGQVTKLRKRASAGVCPCCNRSFQNLRRHMKTKHPDFAE